MTEKKELSSKEIRKRKLKLQRALGRICNLTVARPDYCSHGHFTGKFVVVKEYKPKRGEED